MRSSNLESLKRMAGERKHMSFKRRAFFYFFLLFLVFFAASCATVKPGLPVKKEKDFIPAGSTSYSYYHFLLGQLYQHSGNLDRAMGSYRQALEQGGNSAF